MARTRNRILSTERILVCSGSLMFIAAFLWSYISWVSPYYYYLGFNYTPLPLSYFSLAVFMAFLPSVWLPLKLDRPSKLIYWLIYLIVYVPSMFVPLYANLQSHENTIALMCALLAGFGIIGLNYKLRQSVFPAFAVPEVSSMAFWYTLFSAVIVLTCWVVFVFTGNFILVALDDVYSIRYSGGALMEGTYVGYAVTWLSGSFNPLLMSIGLHKRRIPVFLAGAVGQIVLYSTAGNKTMVFSICFIPMFYFILASSKRWAVRLLWTTIVALVCVNLLNMLVGDGASDLQFNLSALLLMRTFSVPAWSTAFYYDFFSDHPLTYFSHVKGFNVLVDYPYELSIGQEIGYFYGGSTEWNANAHFWSTDGVAGFGLFGIILISAVCGAVFWLLDIAAKRHDGRFAALVMSVGAINLTNTSLFTTLLTGGLALSALILLFMPPLPDNRSIVRRFSLARRARQSYPPGSGSFTVARRNQPFESFAAKTSLESDSADYGSSG